MSVDQLSSALLDQIASGHRGVDGVLAVAEVARQLSVPRDVVEAAARRLLAVGALHLDTRGGYRIGSPSTGGGPADQARREHCDVENVYGLLGNETVEVVDTATVHVGEVDPWVAGALGMGRTRGDGLLRRELVRRDRHPTCVLESWVAITLFSVHPGARQLENTLLSPHLLPRSAAALVAAVVGEQPAREDHVTNATTASAGHAELLELPEGSPVLRVITTASSLTWPLVCTVRTYLPDTGCAFVSFPPTT